MLLDVVLETKQGFRTLLLLYGTGTGIVVLIEDGTLESTLSYFSLDGQSRQYRHSKPSQPSNETTGSKHPKGQSESQPDALRLKYERPLDHGHGRVKH